MVYRWWRDAGVQGAHAGGAEEAELGFRIKIVFRKILIDRYEPAKLASRSFLLADEHSCRI
jgi:hypothetical protein